MLKLMDKIILTILQLNFLFNLTYVVKGTHFVIVKASYPIYSKFDISIKILNFFVKDYN